MTPDKYQQAVIDEYRRTNHNIFISATAGSGKTTCLLELAKRTPPIKSSIFLAFNKSIAEELGRKLPPTVKAMTLHGCALAALRKAFSLKFTIKENKYFSIASEILESHKVHFKRIPGLAVRMCRLHDLMRYNLVSGGVDEICVLAERYGEDCDEKMAGYACELYSAARQAADTFFSGGGQGTISMDFTDMLVWAVKYVPQSEFKQYSVVMCDECQDISALQYELIKRLKTPKGRLVAVGDPRQSIYSFQGSNLDSLHAIQNSLNTVTLPLSITYRCAKAIVREAQRVFPEGIEAASTAVEGTVTRGRLNEAVEGDFILCRNNAPLIDAWLKLVKMGRRCVILGKDFGGALMELLDNAECVDDLEKPLVDLLERLHRKGIERPERTEAYANLDEKVNILLNLFDFFGSLEAVRERIFDIFVENADEKHVILSTIHKSKGLEADRVFFLEPELIPSRFATTELSMYAEKCLMFVAITRAKKELIYI